MWRALAAIGTAGALWLAAVAYLRHRIAGKTDRKSGIVRDAEPKEIEHV